MFNDFELHNVHAERAEIEKWSILGKRKVDYVKYNGNIFPTSRVIFNPTDGICQKG